MPKIDMKVPMATPHHLQSIHRGLSVFAGVVCGRCQIAASGHMDLDTFQVFWRCPSCGDYAEGCSHKPAKGPEDQRDCVLLLGHAGRHACGSVDWPNEALWNRPFRLMRDEDATGTSGVGHVADGYVFFDGTVALRWRTQVSSTAIYASLEDVETIHGHGGKTRIVFER